MFVPRRALVDALVLFSLHSADVHHQGAGVGPHGHVGVLVDVKVRSVSCPRETAQQMTQPGLEEGCFFQYVLMTNCQWLVRKHEPNCHPSWYSSSLCMFIMCYLFCNQLCGSLTCCILQTFERSCQINQVWQWLIWKIMTVREKVV